MEFNNIYSGLISGKEKLALVGLGYVSIEVELMLQMRWEKLLRRLL